MKIIHLLPDINSIHTKHIISALKKWENKLVKDHEQVFFIYGINDKGLKKEEYLIPYKYNLLLFLRIIHHCLKHDKIIIHGGYFKLWILLSFLPKSILKHIKWICWGSQIDRNRTSIKSFIYYKIRYRVFKSLGAINFLIKEEIYLFDKNYHNKNKLYNPYFNLEFEKLKILFPYESIEIPEKINKILIGNNGHYVNNHIEAIDVLYSLNFRVDITIIVSYGSKVLIEDLKDKMNNYSLGNYTPIEKMLSLEELLHTYNNIDAYVAYSDNQTGLFAIYTFLYLKKPIYLKRGSLVEKFMNDHEFNYFYLDEILEFKLIQQQKLIDNHYKVKNFINSDESLNKWNDFFVKM